MKNFLTFDLEEWYDTASMEGWRGERGSIRVLQPAAEQILRIVSPFKATFFVLAYQAKEYAALLRCITREGHEIALHGLRHVPMSRYSPDSFRKDIKTAKAIIEDITGVPVIGFRAPNFSMRQRNLWAIEVLAAHGFEYDASVTMGRLFSCLSRGPLLIREINRGGMSLGGVSLPFGGGIFLRLYPYSWTRSWVMHLNDSGERAMIYAHPWEFDGDWMKVGGLPLRAQLIMGAGLGTTKEKMMKLVRDFEFGSIKEILNEESVMVKS